MSHSRYLFDHLDITIPEIPDRSELFNLEPIGIGTPYVESLTSYIGRLAEAHNVKTGLLLKEILGPRFSKKYLYQVNGQTKSPESFRDFINNYGVIAKEFVSVIEKMTSRNDLQYLTLLPWESFLGNRVLRKHRAWCSLCFEENGKSRKIIYEPLVWQFKIINYCPIHNIKLLEFCSFCHKKNGVLTQSHRVGYCQKCNKNLGLTNKMKHEDQDEKWNIWITENISTLLENQMNLVNKRNTVQDCIKWFIKRYGNPHKFSKNFGVYDSGVHSWVHGIKTPKFETILRLSFYFKVPIYQLFFSDLDQLEVNYPNNDTHNLSDKRIMNKINSENLRRDLKTIIMQTEEPPPSLSEVCRRVMYSRSSLYMYASDLCTIICDRYTNYKKNKKIEKHNKLIREVVQITIDIYKEGEFPNSSRVQRRMSNARSYLIPSVRQAHYKTLDELGITYNKTNN